jgi:hypothetical protein
MIRHLALLGWALLFAAWSTACEPGDRNDARSALDASAAARDGSADSSEAGSMDSKDASTGAGKDAGTGRDARADTSADASCPPTCFRAYTCATSCGAPEFNNGCCPCPAGTIDTITCNAQKDTCGSGSAGCGEEGAACCDPAPCDGPNFCHGALKCCGDSCAATCGDAGGTGYCTTPCTGAAPSPSVVEACQGFTGQSACLAYQATDFPFGCRWVTPATAQCPLIP